MRAAAALLLSAIMPLFTAATAPAQTGAAVERAYTPLDLDKCRHKRGTDAEDYGSWRCRGFGGDTVFVSAGDERTYVSYGPGRGDTQAARETLAAFNSAGNTVEWRIEHRNGKPRAFATILRWTTTVANNGDPIRGQVLVVTRLGPGGVCHVGYVDARANRNANDLAAQIADTRARAFRCGRDKPVVLGETGPGFSGPYND